MDGAVLVTGASRGIGEACALRLAGLGLRVYAGVRDMTVGDALRARVGAGTVAGADLVPVRLDVTDAASIAGALESVEGTLGGRGLVGVVNNAGIAVAGPLELLAEEDLRRQLEVNVVGQLAVTRAFLPLLRRARGRIVFMSSIAGRSALPITGAYSASKHALEALADAWRVELRPWGLDVALVEPGVIATDIWDTSIGAAESRLADLPESSVSLYGAVIEAARRRARAGAVQGLPAERVARVVVHALTARRPRVRYVVGKDARLRLLLERLLPVRARDRLIAGRLARL